MVATKSETIGACQ